MGLLDFVKQHHRVGLFDDLLGKLPAGLVADIPGRRADQPVDRVVLLILGHVQRNQVVLAPEHELGQGPGQLAFADPARPEKQKGADRPFGILEPDPGRLDRPADRAHGLVLAQDALAQGFLHRRVTRPFVGPELGDRDAGHDADRPGHVVGANRRVGWRRAVGFAQRAGPVQHPNRRAGQGLGADIPRGQRGSLFGRVGIDRQPVVALEHGAHDPQRGFGFPGRHRRHAQQMRALGDEAVGLDPVVEVGFGRCADDDRGGRVADKGLLQIARGGLGPPAAGEEAMDVRDEDRPARGLAQGDLQGQGRVIEPGPV